MIVNLNKEWGVSTARRDNAEPINAAIQKYMDTGHTLYVEPGEYQIEKPILVGKYNIAQGQWLQVTPPPIVGGYLAGMNPSKPCCTALRPVFVDEYAGLPAMIVQRVRGAYLQGLMIDCSWMPANSVGFAVDWYGEVENDIWAGPRDRFPHMYVGREGSSKIEVQRCTFVDADVFVLVGAGVTSNSDGIIFHNSALVSRPTVRGVEREPSFVGVSICHSQAGNFFWNYGSMTRIRTAFCTNLHGLRQGSPCRITGPLISRVNTLIYGSSPNTPWVWRDSRMEMIGKIADLDSTHHASQHGLQLDTCTIGLPKQDIDEPIIRGSCGVRVANCGIHAGERRIILEKTRAGRTPFRWIFQDTEFSNDFKEGLGTIQVASGGECIYFNNSSVSLRQGDPPMTEPVMLDGFWNDIKDN